MPRGQQVPSDPKLINALTSSPMELGKGNFVEKKKLEMGLVYIVLFFPQTKFPFQALIMSDTSDTLHNSIRSQL